MNNVGFRAVMNHGNYIMTFWRAASAAITNAVISC